MSHLRQQIRETVVATIEAVGAYAGRVHATRLTPVAAKNLPAVCVYTLEEQSGLDGTAHALRRELTVQVEVVFALADALDDAFDGHAVALETALAADRTLGGICYDILLTASRLSTNAEGENKTAHGLLTYLVSYRSSRMNPENTNP